MPDEVDWSQTTFEGNRKRQHLEFLALPFREKLERIEEMNELVEFFEKSRIAREGRITPSAFEEQRPDSTHAQDI